jgi:signal transduction histidine kinase
MAMETNHKEILENLLHELGGINSIIKSCSEEISRLVKAPFIQKGEVNSQSEILLQNSFLLSTHIDSVVYQMNPAFFSIQRPEKRNIYGKFYKTKLSFERKAKQNDIKLLFERQPGSLIDTFPVIDTLPMLILDNAIKYSLKGSIVEIEYFENDTEIDVSVCNMAPYIYLNERNKLFERGFRGRGAVEMKALGLGLGMSFIKHICDIHQALVWIDFGEESHEVNGVKYCEFKLNIRFQKNASLS